jgi:hypothetical protein
MMILEVGPGDIRADILSKCQADARAGKYAQAMVAFLCWLAARYGELHGRMRADIGMLRQRAVGSNAHRRTADIVANLALGLQHFLAFAQEVRAINADNAVDLWNRCWNALGEAGNRQADHHSANEPGRRFIELLSSAIASGRAHLANREGAAPPNAQAWGWRCNGAIEQAQGARIGWLDGGDVLLDGDAAYRAAQDMAGHAGDGLAVTARTLRKRLSEKGLLIRADDAEIQVRRVVEGRMRYLLQLAPGVLSTESRIYPISSSDPAGDPENGDECGISLRTSTSATPGIPQQNTPSDPSGDPENGVDGVNAGNADLRQGYTPTCAQGGRAR